MAIKIMIDPGHFQNVNPGAATGYYEGNQMWILSGYLKQYLQSYGFIVGMTKKTINDYPKTAKGEDNITARGRMAKGYDLFISMHSNAAASSYVDRPVGIYFVDDNCGQADEVSYAVAKLLASTVEKVMELQTYQVFSKLASGDRDGDGYRNDDYYGVLFGAHQVGVAGVIMEHSFHTNKTAAQWLLSDANLKTLAKAEAEAIAGYYGVIKPTTSVTPTTPTVSTGTLYRVRKDKGDGTGDPATQKGAYANLAGAKSLANELGNGYKVWDQNGKLIYDPGTSAAPETAEVKLWKNGSTSEPVYADTAKMNKVGSLNPYESCECLGTIGGMYIVKYRVDGTNTYKVGVVEYSGGL